MPYNRPGKMHYAVATKTVVHGESVTEAGVVGTAVKQQLAPFGTGPASNAALKTVQIGESFAIITKGIVEVAAVGSPVVGDPIYIVAADNTLTKTASANFKYGRIAEIAGSRGTPTGRMRVNLDLKDSF